MKRPCLKYHAPPGARYKCSFPGCEKRYVSTDGVRKHARKRHTEWLAAVDEHSGLRDKAFESKPSTYCVMEYDDEDDFDASEDASASWRSESVPSDNESAMPNDVASAPCVPVVAREVVRATPIGERLASIAKEMNAEAEALMSTSLPSVPDFLRMINTHSSPVLAPRAISSDDEPSTPPNTPPRSDPEYTTPWTKGLSGPGAGSTIMPFVLDELPSKTPAAAAAGSDRAERAAVAEAESGDPRTNEPEEATLLNMAESEAFVSMLLACA